MGERRLTKNEKKRLKKKALANAGPVVDKSNLISSSSSKSNNIQMEYIAGDVGTEDNDNGITDEILKEFSNVFEKFIKPEELTKSSTDDDKKKSSSDIMIDVGNGYDDDDDEVEIELSNAKKKKLMRLKESELKMLVERPDLVEPDDPNAPDPFTLLYLKGIPNTVPVPTHWNSVRKYLMGKIGHEKTPYALPAFIAETGIQKIREAVMEQESAAAAKRAARDRVRPKMGKIDIDYQVLHDAFFKYQEKPKLTKLGQQYYEGKERDDVSIKNKQPGNLSNELKIALGLPEGAAGDVFPPPWILNMQRYGPPPGHPNVKYPGVNTKLPLGASYGNHRGGWGNPPVDADGKGLYGDVMGQHDEGEELIDRSLWGSFQDIQVEEEIDDDDDDDEDQIQVVAGDDALAVGETLADEVLDGSANLAALENTVMELRKRKGGTAAATTTTTTTTTLPESDAPKQLYEVIQEKEVTMDEGDIFGSDRKFVIPNSNGGNDNTNDDDGTTTEIPDSEEAPKLASKSNKRKNAKDSNPVKKKMKDFKF